MDDRTERKVFELKVKARAYNHMKEWDKLAGIIHQLEVIWDDHEAAKDFYTLLETEAEQ